jgi:hypothetical protein
MVAGREAPMCPGEQGEPSCHLVSHFEARIDVAKKTVTERMALHAIVVTEQTMAMAVATLRAGFKSYLQGHYGRGSPELQKFGFTAQKPMQKAAVTKARAAKQNVATRKARGTTGKKAKVNIKGVVASDAVTNAGASGTAAATS